MLYAFRYICYQRNEFPLVRSASGKRGLHFDTRLSVSLYVSKIAEKPKNYGVLIKYENICILDHDGFVDFGRLVILLELHT